IFEKSWRVLARGGNGSWALALPPRPRVSVIRCSPNYSFQIQAGPGKPLLCRNFGRNVDKIHECALRFAIRTVCVVPATLATCGPAYMNHLG
ncbi:MAG: hypothetical protein ABGZ35_31240, partial [Planctomycetaceae bacterium]